MRKAVGPHIHSRRAPDLTRRWLEVARPAVVKWLAEALDAGELALARQLGAVTVARKYWPSQSISGAGADQHLSDLSALMRAWPSVRYWEGVNEAFQSAGELAARASFDVRLMHLAESHGALAAIGSFSVGEPKIEDWRHYLPALRYAAARGHAVALHEYSSPAMQWGAGANTLPSAVAGGRWERFDPCTRPGVAGWFVLRYRRVLEAWRQLGVDPLPRIIITEGGIDRLHADQVPGNTAGRGRGWRDALGLAPRAAGDYADQLRWISERWAEDAEVLGGVDFGFADASGEWGAFDLSTDRAMFERVVAELAAIPGGAPAPAPTPAPRPAPDPTPVSLPAPRPSSASVVVAVPAPGESPAQFAGRAAGWPDAPYSVRLAFWRELAAFNHLQFDRVHAGRLYRLPWFEPTGVQR